MREVRLEDLEEAVRSSGYFRQKARKLKLFLAWLDARHGGSLARASRVQTDELRAQLLGIWGIGPETADSILLYVFGRPVFVVDAYTHRVLRRHGLHPGGGYEAVRAFLESNVRKSASLYNDFHAQIVWVGHRFCGTRAHCEACPLRDLLPGGKPMAEAVVKRRPRG